MPYILINATRPTPALGIERHDPALYNPDTRDIRPDNASVRQALAVLGHTVKVSARFNPGLKALMAKLRAEHEAREKAAAKPAPVSHEEADRALVRAIEAEMAVILTDPAGPFVVRGRIEALQAAHNTEYHHKTPHAVVTAVQAIPGADVAFKAAVAALAAAMNVTGKVVVFKA